VRDTGSTPNGSSAHLNHYDELVELARDVAGPCDRYGAGTTVCFRCLPCRARHLLARLPNQAKAALAADPPPGKQ